MQRWAIALFSAILVAVFSMGTASAAKLKIGIIDTQKIIQKSKAARDARGAFLMDVESKRSILKSKEKEVRRLGAELKKGASVAPGETTAKREALARQAKELKRLKTDLEEELKKKDREMTRKLLVQIREVVEGYREKKKFSLIMERKMAVAWDEALDISDDIIKRLDATKK
jgi:outer membrane protein